MVSLYALQVTRLADLGNPGVVPILGYLAVPEIPEYMVVYKNENQESLFECLHKRKGELPCKGWECAIEYCTYTTIHPLSCYSSAPLRPLSLCLTPDKTTALYCIESVRTVLYCTLPPQLLPYCSHLPCASPLVCARAEPVLNLVQRVRIMVNLSDTLATLHASSPPLAHRNLKPTNIMLTREGLVSGPLLLTVQYCTHSNVQNCTHTLVASALGPVASVPALHQHAPFLTQ